MVNGRTDECASIDHSCLLSEGDRHFFGKGCRRDLGKAVEYYSRAADAGSDEAQYNLGYCYEEGLGVFRSPAKAVKWYRRSAGLGNAKAQNNLGNCYYWGSGVAQDYKEAFKWYALSASQDYGWAQYNLAECYDEGRGTAKNPAEAQRLYALAAAQGIDDAREAMLPSVRRRKKRIGTLLRILYAAGVLLFIWFMVGNYHDAKAYNVYMKAHKCYEKKDYAEALRLCNEAIGMGCADAINLVGLCYERGCGVEKDKKKAYEHFCLAIEEGSAQALCNKARFLENGIYVSKDVDAATRCYEEAAEYGLNEAKAALERIRKKKR